ncbi:MAG: aminoglycoside phosphotransferase family protein [Acidimicrobiia bacterium]|nr:aminoglycoside phosphotransferase family protein [Acidimicrobiia bacterium]
MTGGFDLTVGPIAAGRTAEVFAVGDSEVLKLLRPGFDPHMLSVEYDKTAAVGTETELAPRVSGLVEVDGRPGIVFERIVGDSMLDSIQSSRDAGVGYAVALADLHTRVLSVSVAADLPDVKDFMADKIDNADLPVTQRSVAKDHMAGLPGGAATLHGDFHPGNVLITTAGPRVIDWGEASHGDPAADIARTMLLLTPESAAASLPQGAPAPASVAAFAHAYLERCLQAPGITMGAISAWRLPVIAARLSEYIAEETRLLQAEAQKLSSEHPNPRRKR